MVQGNSQQSTQSVSLLVGGIVIGMAIALALACIATVLYTQVLVPPPTRVAVVSTVSPLPSQTPSPSPVNTPASADTPTASPGIVNSGVITVVVTATPMPSAPVTVPSPQVVVVTATPSPRQTVISSEAEPKYRVAQIACNSSNPDVWHHGLFTIEGTVYVPSYIGPNNDSKIWANHTRVGGAQSPARAVQVSNETEEWMSRLYVLPLYENGGPGVWYVWVIEQDQRVSDVAQVTIDGTCPHAVVDFRRSDFR